MSDRASLEIRGLTARVAELEGERDRWQALAESRHADAVARITELEAKVARYEADLEDPTLSVGEAYAFRSESHGPSKKPIK